MAEKLFLFDLDGTALGGYEPYALFPQHFCEFLDRIHNEGWDWGINSAWDMPGQWDLAGKSPVKSRPSVLIVSFGRGIYDCRSGEPVAVEPYCREMEKRLEIYEQEILIPALQPVLDEGKHRDVIRRRHNYSVEYGPEGIDTATYIHKSPAWQSMIKSGNFEVMPLPGAVRVRSTFCTKAAPMHLLEPVFGYKPEHVVTAGDGTPDIHLVSSPYAKYAVTPANGDQMLKDYVSIHGGAIGKQDYAAGITEAFETLRNEKKSEQEKRYAECN